MFWKKRFIKLIYEQDNIQTAELLVESATVGVFDAVVIGVVGVGAGVRDVVCCWWWW